METTGHKRFVLGFLAYLATAILAISIFNFTVDPLQAFRKPSFYKPAYIPGYQRHQYVGLARNYQYDTVVIGSSLLENFIPSYINRSWGVHAMKLAISGSTSYEQFLILGEALRTGQVRNVIWGLDGGVFYGSRTWVRDDQAPFPYYMYRHPRFLNIEYLYSLDTMRLSGTILSGGGEHDLDRLDTWDTRFEFSEAATLKSWNGNCDQFAQSHEKGDAMPSENRLREMRVAVENNLAKVVRGHPEITFHLFFPPVSTLAHFPKSQLSSLISFKREAQDSLIDFGNVRFHDFHVGTSTITDNLNNYKDPIHFSRQVSEYVIDAIREGKHRVLRKDIEPNVRRLIDHVNNYDLCRARRSQR